jgi:hypothetical protein
VRFPAPEPRSEVKNSWLKGVTPSVSSLWTLGESIEEAKR